MLDETYAVQLEIQTDLALGVDKPHYIPFNYMAQMHYQKVAKKEVALATY